MIESLDFSRALLSEVDSLDLHLLNIPFKGESGTKFVIVQTNKSGTIIQGRIISLLKTSK